MRGRALQGEAPSLWCGGKRGICGFGSGVGEGWACRLGKVDLLSGWWGAREVIGRGSDGVCVFRKSPLAVKRREERG